MMTDEVLQTKTVDGYDGTRFTSSFIPVSREYFPNSLYDGVGHKTYWDRVEVRECSKVVYRGEFSRLATNEYFVFAYQRHGQGKEYAGDSVVYDGMWQYDSRHGHGTEYDKDGTIVYSGQWRRGKKVVDAQAMFDTIQDLRRQITELQLKLA